MGKKGRKVLKANKPAVKRANKRARKKTAIMYAGAPKHNVDPLTGVDFDETERQILHCAKGYVASLADPFAGIPSCAPFAPTLDSAKEVTWCRGTGNIGTAGVGGVSARPCMSTDFSVIYTVSTYTATLLPSTTATVGCQAAATNSRYAPADFVRPASGGAAGGRFVAGRVVACGIRVWYTGTELNKAGWVYPFTTPEHSPVARMGVVSSGFGPPDFEAFKQFEGSSYANRGPHGTVWTPKKPLEMRYSDGSSNSDIYVFDASGLPDTETMPMGILIQGTPGESFKWEYYCLYEATGNIITQATPTYASGALGQQILSSITKMSTSTLANISALGRDKITSWASDFVGGLLAEQGKASMSALSQLLGGSRRLLLGPSMSH